MMAGPRQLLAWTAGAALVCASCLARQTTEQHEIVEADSSQLEHGSLACAGGSKDALALLDPIADGGGCGVAIELGEGGELSVIRRLRVDELELPAVLARGRAPEACGVELEWCELSGTADTLGPIMIASVRGTESEMPTQVYVGWVDGARLVFVETWYGLPSVVDHTRIGPPWALAAFDCGGELFLLPAPRLPEAGREAPSATLHELAGRWRVDDAGIPQPPEQPATVDPATCRALIPELP
jgi:hypothetical protein